MERALIEQAQKGDRAAFDALVRLKVDAVYGTALAILGHEADAQDAVQEAFVAAWRSLGGLRDPDRFEAWFGRIVVNACRMSLRRRKVRQIEVTDGSIGEGSEVRGAGGRRTGVRRCGRLRRELRPGVRAAERRRAGDPRAPPSRRPGRGRHRGPPRDPCRNGQVATVRRARALERALAREDR